MEQYLEIVKGALSLAQSKGAYTLKDASIIFEAITGLEKQINDINSAKEMQKEPVKSEAEVID